MNWLQKLRDEPVAGRLASSTDRDLLSDLVARAIRRHGVLALEEQLSLLSSGVSAFAFYKERPVAFLGMRLRDTTDGDREHWVEASLVVIASGVGNEHALRAMLRAVAPQLRALGATALVCLTGHGWLHDALLRIGFAERDQVITYARSHRLQPPVAAAVAELRPAIPTDAGLVLEINAAAFTSLWRYDSATTLGWLMTSDHAVIAERNGRAVGFALTSRSLNSGYDQLVRLATRPDFQGHGVGRQLVVDSVAFSRAVGAPGLALNTQATNKVSRHLYEDLDFRVIGAPVLVLIYPLE